MGIAPYKYFTFDGASSRSYDVYLTGKGVFDAPERAVEMIEIPGRNGNYALDQGRFENITVTYRAGIVDASESNFADKVSAVRNWLCSKVGYKRLEDDYNPNEYRMALFSNGITIDHEDLRTGEFDITFECKPQRWLTSGETATAVANNGTLNNPTLFDASPLLEVKGYGNIDIGGQDIDIEDGTIGYVILNEGSDDFYGNRTKTLDTSMFLNGDNITANVGYGIRYQNTTASKVASITVGICTNCTANARQVTNGRQISVMCDTVTVAKGTSQTDTWSATYTVTIQRISDHSTVQTTCTVSGTLTYDGDGTFEITTSGSYSVNNSFYQRDYMWGRIEGTSTKSALGDPMYIDLDIGECWNEDSGTPVSVNNAVQLGSDLPVLPPGSTTFTYDNTITSFKVKPRWWKV